MPDQIRVDTAQPIPILGRLLGDGSAIDRLSQDRLILFHEGKSEIAQLIIHNEVTYQPRSLDPQLESLLYLPSRSQDFSSLESLVEELSTAIREIGEVEEPVSLLLATYVLSTWVPECLPQIPCLNICGPTGAESTLIELLTWLCRRAVRLADISSAQLASLPSGLGPTLILKRPDEHRLMRTLPSVTDPDVMLLHAGRWLNPHCSIVACSREPLSCPALHVRLLPSRSGYRRLGRTDGKVLADEFQPRLLSFRLSRHLQIVTSQFDDPSFAADVRILARSLGAAVEGAPALQDRIITALTDLDEQDKTDQAQSLPAVVLEALLVLCHENRPTASVLEVTKLANVIMIGRGETLQFSPKQIGGELRKFGLSPRRRMNGYELGLELELRRRIHRLAIGYHVLSLQIPRSGCPACADLVDPGQNKIEIPMNVHDVHNVRPDR